ncbi:MAG: GMC family oxidoreductase, partial [Halobacteriota archaeon]
MTAVDRTPSDDADVCIVGSGPAGALPAYRLADEGYDVVVLEAGRRFPRSERLQRMERSIRPAWNDDEVWSMGGARDRYVSDGERSYPLNAARVKGVGGTTLHWQGMVMRLHERDFELRSRTGLGRDWPISYDDVRPYYAEAERELGVAGGDDNPYEPPRDEPHPMPAFPASHSDSLLREACEEAGLTVHSTTNARNSEPYDDRSECVAYGTCQPVCPSGAKYSADVHVRKAESEGARVIDRARVTELEHDRRGDHVEAAVYVTPDETRHRQEADVFVVACGGVETPRLLLNSDSREHPDGLANSSGAVGRYFTDHVFAGAGGVVDFETRQNHVGFVTSESHEYYDGDELTPLGVKIELFNYAGPSPVVSALDADTWGDELLERLRDEYGGHVGLGALVEQLPRRENRVSLDPDETDDLGLPVPRVTWDVDENTERAITEVNDVQ